MRTVYVLIAVALTCLIGCATSAKQVSKKSQAAAQTNLQTEATPRAGVEAERERKFQSERERKFEERLAKLRKGMTPAEVSKVLGIQFGLLPIQGRVTFPNGHSVAFSDGRLQEWD